MAQRTTTTTKTVVEVKSTGPAKVETKKEVPGVNLQKYVKPGVTLEDITKIKQCFDIFDYDKGGSISPEELRETIIALGLQKDAAKILALVEQHSHNEELDFDSFLEIFGFTGDLKSETTLQGLFDEFDKDRKGYFTLEDFNNVCTLLGERFSVSEIEQMIKFADKDNDNVINYQEFVDVVTREYPKV